MLNAEISLWRVWTLKRTTRRCLALSFFRRIWGLPPLNLVGWDQWATVTVIAGNERGWTRIIQQKKTLYISASTVYGLNHWSLVPANKPNTSGSFLMPGVSIWPTALRNTLSSYIINPVLYVLSFLCFQMLLFCKFYDFKALIGSILIFLLLFFKSLSLQMNWKRPMQGFFFRFVLIDSNPPSPTADTQR